MVRPTNVRVEYSNEATVNTGNFQNVRPGYRVSADVPDDGHPADVLAKLESLVDGLLDARIQAIESELNE